MEGNREIRGEIHWGKIPIRIRSRIPMERKIRWDQFSPELKPSLLKGATKTASTRIPPVSNPKEPTKYQIAEVSE